MTSPLLGFTSAFRVSDAFLVATIVIVVTGCGENSNNLPPAGSERSDTGPYSSETSSNPFVKSTPLNAFSEPGTTLFELLGPDQTNIRIKNPIDMEHTWAHLYDTAFGGCGVAIGDFDADGRPDIFLTSQTDANRLYRQTGDMKFDDVTEETGLSTRITWGAGAAFADINNDGHLDLYVCNYDTPNELYINDGNGRFTEKAKDHGLDFVGASVMVTFSDYDRDGDMDMYLVTNRKYPIPGFRPQPKITDEQGRPYRGLGIPVVAPESRDDVYFIKQANGEYKRLDAGQRDYLYRNNSDGTFTDVTHQARMDVNGHYHTLSATWWDFNNDGYEDLYVANDFWDPDLLYRNNGDGTFTNVIKEMMPYTTWFSMGADVADINNDGRADLLVGDMAATTQVRRMTMAGAIGLQFWFYTSIKPHQYSRNTLFINTGANRFIETAYQAGVAATDWTWSVKFGDFDNDGRQDIYFTNGVVHFLMDPDADRKLNAIRREFMRKNKGRLTREQERELEKAIWRQIQSRPPLREENIAYRNVDGKRFDKVSSQWGLDFKGISFGAAQADLDRDGDLDFVVNNTGDAMHVYRNTSQTGRRVLIQLKGINSNRFGLGARIQVKANGTTQTRWIKSASGYMAADEPVAHFAVGKIKSLDEVVIHWPSGVVQRLVGLKTNHLHVIREPESQVSTEKKSQNAVAKTWFKSFTAFDQFEHVEKPFNDYLAQPLLPRRLSHQGPPLTWGDVDGDGDDDLYVGAGTEMPGQLFINQGGGKFTPGDRKAWIADRYFEDTGGVFLDADSDGDLDLYVCSGSIERKAGTPTLQDRLYLNDGKGVFSRAPYGTLPPFMESTNAVATADVDADGDMDLFVGVRSIPGRYPTSGKSRLILNDGGKFRDDTDQSASGFSQMGMVTGATFADVDGDGDYDLIATTEWGPVRVFANHRGKFTDVTSKAQISHLTGWWNGVSPADVDGDGDVDFVVTNFGTNTKYKASPKNPATLFYGKFSNNKTSSIIEARWENGQLYPTRSLTDFSYVIPDIATRFTSHQTFGKATINQVFGKDKVAAALKVQATELRSGVFINESKDSIRFRFEPLPDEAQVSPSFGAAITDFNGDGYVDILLAQNFFHSEVSTGRMSAGVGIVLKNRGNGKFVAVHPGESGISITGDARAATIVDLNDDDWPDVLVSQNNTRMMAYTFQKPKGHARRLVSVRLLGKKGNPSGFGAKLVYRGESHKQSRFICSSSGYMSHSSALRYFSLKQGESGEITVTWPDGTKSKHPLNAKTNQKIIRQKP